MIPSISCRIFHISIHFYKFFSLFLLPILTLYLGCDKTIIVCLLKLNKKFTQLKQKAKKNIILNKKFIYVNKLRYRYEYW